MPQPTRCSSGGIGMALLARRQLSLTTPHGPRYRASHVATASRRLQGACDPQPGKVCRATNENLDSKPLRSLLPAYASSILAPHKIRKTQSTVVMPQRIHHALAWKGCRWVEEPDSG